MNGASGKFEVVKGEGVTPPNTQPFSTAGIWTDT